MFSPTYISGAVIVAVQVLGWLGINMDVAALETTATTLITIIAGIVIAYRRWAKGDISALGSRQA